MGSFSREECLEMQVEDLEKQLTEANDLLVIATFENESLVKQLTEAKEEHAEMFACKMAMEGVVLQVEQENKRLLARDGKATITLSYQTKDYPFNTEDLEVVDFGVADNGYMVTSKLFNAMQQENKRLLATVKRAYLKHHCDVDFIGWEDLDKELFDTLCESLGDGEFCSWLEQALKKEVE